MFIGTEGWRHVIHIPVDLSVILIQVPSTLGHHKQDWPAAKAVSKRVTPKYRNFGICACVKEKETSVQRKEKKGTNCVPKII